MRPILTVVNSGGHLTQALCVMSAVDEFHLVTSVEIDMDVGAKSINFIKGTQFNPFIYIFNIFNAFRIVRKIRPAAIFSTGSTVCIPFSIVAKLCGIKFIYLDTLSRVEDLSNTAQFLYKYKLASEIYCQWRHVADKYDEVTYCGKTFNICDSRHVTL